MSGFGKRGGFGGGNKGGSRRKSGERVIPYKNPHDDPFANLSEGTGDIETDTNEEVEAIGSAFQGFKDRMKTEQKRFDLAVDANFWSGICFRTHEDKTAFLKAVGVTRLYNGQHIDGYALSDLLGLDVEYKDR